MIDIIIFISYLALLLIVSIVKKRKGGNFSSLTKISNKLKGNKLILVATIFTSAIGGGTTFGLSEKVFTNNAAYAYGLALVIPIDILIAIFILPKLIIHYSSETIGDIMSHYYGKAGRYIGGGSAILVSTGILAAQISVSGRIFEYILNIDYLTGVIISYLIIVLYTTIGGLQSILFANLLQFFAIILSIPVISFIVIGNMGIEDFISKLPLEKISLCDQALLQDTINAALGFMFINLLPTFIQRVLINQNIEVTKKAIYFKSIIYFIFLIFVTLNGLLAFMLYPEVKASLALPHLIDHTIPTGIQGLVVVGLLAAVMSTADSDLNIISTTLVKDFMQPIFNIYQSSMVFFARIINILVGTLAIFIALKFSTIVELVIFVSGFWGPVTLIPLIFGLYKMKIGTYQYIVTCLIGIFSFILWSSLFEDETSLKAIFIGTICNFVAFFIFYIWNLLENHFNKIRSANHD